MRHGRRAKERRNEMLKGLLEVLFFAAATTVAFCLGLYWAREKRSCRSCKHLLRRNAICCGNCGTRVQTFVTCVRLDLTSYILRVQGIPVRWSGERAIVKHRLVQGSKNIARVSPSNTSEVDGSFVVGFCRPPTKKDIEAIVANLEALVLEEYVANQ